VIAASPWAFALGLALPFVGWLLPRIVAGARIKPTPALALDLAPPLAFFVFCLALTARPLFSGCVSFALMGGFAFTDKIKRLILREPAVFSDIGELVELFRHPQLYLPFAGPARVIACAAATGLLFVTLLFVEPAAWRWSAWALLIPAAMIALGWAAHGPWLAGTAAVLRRLSATGEPDADARSIGPLAMQLVYSLIAREERTRRRNSAFAAAPALIVRDHVAAGPVIVAQCESFFDPRRMHPRFDSGLLPAFTACRDASIQTGRLLVPGWGANTTRSEFAVLTGMPESAIGLDRFNPYFALARSPLPSLAWRMRSQGYRTICLHPFDRTFYRRDQVMLNLGFDVFLGEEAFPGAPRSGPYIADTEVARVAIDLMREEGSRLFLFAITMENHGPWDSPAPIAEDPAFCMPAECLPPMPESGAMLRYLRGLKSGDAMLGMLMEALSARGGPGLCAFYGDHLPSFPAAFKALGFDDPRTDYAVWRTGGGPGIRRDLAAHQLGDVIFDALRAPFGDAGIVRLQR
jgi:hypothetical protein